MHAKLGCILDSGTLRKYNQITRRVILERRRVLELVYSNAKTEEQCTSLKAAKKLFGGNIALANSLLARINALNQAETIKDIIIQPAFHFHNLKNKGGRNLEGYFAIDVKSRRDQWRIILEPLDENKEPYVPCNIDEISQNVKVVEIMEVSKHYE